MTQQNRLIREFWSFVMGGLLLSRMMHSIFLTTLMVLLGFMELQVLNGYQLNRQSRLKLNHLNQSLFRSYLSRIIDPFLRIPTLTKSIGFAKPVIQPQFQLLPLLAHLRGSGGQDKFWRNQPSPRRCTKGSSTLGSAFLVWLRLQKHLLYVQMVRQECQYYVYQRDDVD